jgi:hypothetical protein
MVSSFIQNRPREDVVNILNMLNAEHMALKDPVLNHFASNCSVKDRDKIWSNINTIFSEVLQPMLDLI